jgi:hypothetical protein
MFARLAGPAYRTVAPVVALAWFAGAGCYDPKIMSGRLQCASPPAKRCPDGFECSGAGTCVLAGTAGGTGGTGVVDAGSDAAQDSGSEPCLSPRSPCEPQSGMCDPYCQTGCTGCRERCSVNGAGALLCTETMSRPRQVGQTCLITNAGQPDQGDDCGPGLVCMEDCGGGGRAHCYQFCRSDAECPQSTCTRRPPGGGNQRVCEVPFANCDPQNNQGCADTLHGCYLLSSETRPGGTGDRTVCDCSMGQGTAGQSCSDSRDCFMGLVCPTSGAGSGYCRRVCDPDAASPGCQGTLQCRRYGAWGYCM